MWQYSGIALFMVPVVVILPQSPALALGFREKVRAPRSGRSLEPSFMVPVVGVFRITGT